MNNTSTFEEHDRAVEESPARRDLDAAIQHVAECQGARDRIAAELRTAKQAGPSLDGVTTEYSKKLHREKLAELQQKLDLASHNVAVAESKIEPLKVAYRQARARARYIAHREIVLDLIELTGQLRERMAAAQAFRKLCLNDGVVFDSPLHGFSVAKLHVVNFHRD